MLRVGDLLLHAGIFLTVERTNPANPIRNIRVIMPGYEDSYKQQVRGQGARGATGGSGADKYSGVKVRPCSLPAV